MASRWQLVCPRHSCFEELPSSYPWLPDFGFLAASTGRGSSIHDSGQFPQRPRYRNVNRKSLGRERMNKPLAFWSLSTTEMLKQLQTAKEGLTADEARERLARYGSNLPKPAKRSDLVTLLFDQFKSPLIL